MRKFMILWFGEFVSSIGSGMTAFALSIYVYEMTGRASAVSGVVLAAFLPTVLLSPLGGILADRYDRRILMLIGDLFSGLGISFVLWNIHIGVTNLFPIFCGVAFNGIFVALMEPAFKATITDLLSADEYAKAGGLVQIVGSARYLFSPILAGILLSVFDIRFLLLLDIGTFFFTVGTICLVRREIGKSEKKERKPLRVEMKEALIFLKVEKGIRSLVFLMMVTCFFVGFLQTLIVPMILAVSDTKTLGILESVCAIGMMLGSILIGIFGMKRNFVRALSFAGMASSFFMIVAGVNENIGITGSGIFGFFFFLPFINMSADVLVRNRIDGHLQGRIWGIIGLLSQMGTALAYAVSGVVADLIFEPLLVKEGYLASTIGALIGVGRGRGIGFLFILSGIGMFVSMFTVGKRKEIQKLEITCLSSV